MRFLILNTDYPAFLRWFYTEQPGLAAESYAWQMQARIDSLFGVADFYSSNLRKLGHEAAEIYLNNETLQRAWAREHGVALPSPRRSLQFRLRCGVVPWAAIAPDQAWMRAVLAAQIKDYKPEVILNQDLRAVNAQFLKKADSCVRLVIGQCAAPLSKSVNLRGYDLMLSSLPNFVERFGREGLKAELHRLAFEPRVLETLPPAEQPIPASFVGTLSPDHRSRIDLLEQLCQDTTLSVWGTGVEALPKGSRIRSHHRGQAWGRQMYQILRDSRLTLNQHIGIAGRFANNMRLFEATGVGTLLVTDWKQNLGDMFEPAREVLVYRTPAECVALVQHYAGHPDEAAAIAREGQRRTLRDHTYGCRMQQLVDIVRGQL